MRDCEFCGCDYVPPDEPCPACGAESEAEERAREADEQERDDV
jgi:uncharacterized OB-fold protein